MELDTTHLVALAAALGWASGLRLYAVLFFDHARGRQHLARTVLQHRRVIAR